MESGDARVEGQQRGAGVFLDRRDLTGGRARVGEDAAAELVEEIGVHRTGGSNRADGVGVLRLERDEQPRLATLDPDALVIDTTDGWAAITVAGGGARSSFGLLSRLELPDAGFTQGEVVHVPAKVIADDEQVLILAPSMWEAHLLDRVTKALGATGRLETREWRVPTP